MGRVHPWLEMLKVGVMKTVALVVNVLKKDAQAATVELISFLKKKGVAVIVDRETAEAVADAEMGREA